MRYRRKRFLIGLLGLLLFLFLSLLSVFMFLKHQWHAEAIARRVDLDFSGPERLYPTGRRSASLTDHKFTYHLNLATFEEELPYLQSYNCTVLEEEAEFCQSPNGKPLLVLAVKSHPSSSVRRAALRRTWAVQRQLLGYNIKAVFLMATTGSTRYMRVVSEEVKEYHDILMWDFVESMHNLSLKERCFLEWLHHNCKEAKFIFKGDDDEFVNPEVVVRYVAETPDAAAAIHGSMQNTSVVMRTGKYRVSEDLFPYLVYPLFVSGGGFIMPGDFIPALYQASTWLPGFPLDDVYFGLLALAANLSFRHDDRFYTLGTWGGLCSYKRALVVHGVTPEVLVQIWQGLQGEVSCPESEVFLLYVLLILSLGVAFMFLVGRLKKHCKVFCFCWKSASDAE
ncbi:beta-1,3-galactosyltransferase 5-like [Ambystoma mexicanum]|uniref:beta-1,3-galactosyltransferase 5-like n=1 Tax=Ambystoma mexicanum TaxID=8296 RepID=UPI0037E9421A